MIQAVGMAALVAWCFVIPGVVTDCLPRWLFLPAIAVVAVAMMVAPE